MSEEVKFSEEELKEVKGIQDEYFEIQNEYGQISVARLKISKQLDELNKVEEQLEDRFEKNETSEKDFINKITEKYGDGSLNPETGVFIPNKTQ